MGTVSQNRSLVAEDAGVTGSFEALIDVLANEFDARTFREGDVFWIGDEKRRIELNGASFPEILSRLVDEYTVTITSTVLPEGEVSISGDYFLRELIPILCKKFNVAVAYRAGNIAFSEGAGGPDAKNGN